MAAVVTVEVTIKAINPQTRGITVVYETELGETTIELDVSRKAKITVKDVIGVYLRYCFGDQKYIVLNLFSMGAWATGFNMALASQSLGVVKSVGPDIDKILGTMRFFGNKYPYILNGYPPFLKHLMDEGEKRGFDWKNHTIHILVGGEGMSEGLRDYLLKYAKTVFSGYGASDLEIGMAGENPLTVMIRKQSKAMPGTQLLKDSPDSFDSRCLDRVMEAATARWQRPQLILRLPSTPAGPSFIPRIHQRSND